MKKLNLSYKSQRDNKLNSAGSCNVTCVAMVLEYYGAKGDGSSTQLEDQLYARMEREGLSRHSPYDLQTVMKRYEAPLGIRTSFTERGSLQGIIKAIDEGSPVILHAFLTSYGHIVVINGYDAAKQVFNVLDSWGEYWSTGYDSRPSQGKDEQYSYSLIQRLAQNPDGKTKDSFWMHTFRKA